MEACYNEKEGIRDITIDSAKEILSEIQTGYLSAKNKNDFLENIFSFNRVSASRENLRGKVNFVLPHYIIKGMMFNKKFHYDYQGIDIPSFDDLSDQMNKSGVLNTYFTYKNHLVHIDESGIMYLLDRLAELYEQTKKDISRPRLKLEISTKMKNDLKDLLSHGHISNKSTTGITNGDRIDFKDAKLAVVVFDRWRETGFISNESQKNQIIEDNILINGKPPKIDNTIKNARSSLTSHKVQFEYKEMLSQIFKR